MTAGLVAILCCVGPAALALLGVVGGATAFALATELYAEWAWWFRAAGAFVGGVLVWLALRHRGACSVDGIRRSWRSLAAIAAVALLTYVVAYSVTTWLGTLA